MSDLLVPVTTYSLFFSTATGLLCTSCPVSRSFAVALLTRPALSNMWLHALLRPAFRVQPNTHHRAMICS
jgi:hypothetical protein